MKATFLTAATAALLMSASSATATVVVFSTPINVPNTFAGVYVNLLTGASGITPAAVPGWDIDLWGNANNLAFFFNGTPASSSGGVAGSTTGPYLDLAPGAVVSAGSTFSAVTASLAAAAFQAPGNHILGFRFFNESTNAINYGYMTTTSEGANGFPHTITGWAFENNGGAITIPSVSGAVPEPATWAMMLMGFGAIGWAMRRRRATTVRVSYST
ncbi:MAG: PEPxxWA-CTERM sorting domain-containing protein [Pseudomonadota bacterium]